MMRGSAVIRCDAVMLLLGWLGVLKMIQGTLKSSARDRKGVLDLLHSEINWRVRTSNEIGNDACTFLDVNLQPGCLFNTSARSTSLRCIPNSGPPPSKITRVHSCVSCQRSKFECDGKRPCSLLSLHQKWRRMYFCKVIESLPKTKCRSWRYHRSPSCSP